MSMLGAVFDQTITLPCCDNDPLFFGLSEERTSGLFSEKKSEKSDIFGKRKTNFAKITALYRTIRAFCAIQIASEARKLCEKKRNPFVTFKFNCDLDLFVEHVKNVLL